MAEFVSQRRTKRLFRRLTITMIGLMLIWTAGLIRFADSIPKQIEEPTRRTDAIIVLTGGSGRLEEGLNLLELNMAEMLFVLSLSGSGSKDTLQNVQAQPSGTRISHRYWHGNEYSWQCPRNCRLVQTRRFQIHEACYGGLSYATQPDRV